ncbi:hypothetical protein ACLOJK_029463, partial [Asimina triloba]
MVVAVCATIDSSLEEDGEELGVASSMLLPSDLAGEEEADSAAAGGTIAGDELDGLR